MAVLALKICTQATGLILKPTRGAGRFFAWCCRSGLAPRLGQNSQPIGMTFRRHGEWMIRDSNGGDASAFFGRCWYEVGEQSICDGDAQSPFRPYGGSLFVRRDKK